MNLLKNSDKLFFDGQLISKQNLGEHLFFK